MNLSSIPNTTSNTMPSLKCRNVGLIRGGVLWVREPHLTQQQSSHCSVCLYKQGLMSRQKTSPRPVYREYHLETVFPAAPWRSESGFRSSIWRMRRKMVSTGSPRYEMSEGRWGTAGQEYMMEARPLQDKDRPSATVQRRLLLFTCGGYGHLEEYSAQVIKQQVREKWDA